MLNRSDVSASDSMRSKRFRKKGNTVHDRAILQPWFLPLRTSGAILRLLPPEYRKKMRHYFDDYGCLKCERVGGLYSSNGMCKRCVVKILRRLRSSVRRHLTNSAKDGRLRSSDEFLTNAKIARRLLEDMVPASPIRIQSGQNGRLGPRNPAREIFGSPNRG